MDSPLPSPDDVACYEECVTDETYVPSPVAFAHGIPKSHSSGRVTKRGRTRSKSLKERKCSNPLVVKWLDENYELVAGACLPRSVLYTHYQDFCKKNQLEPSSAASFGKIIRRKFPSLSTRRLGTRGQSKYHYYGLAIKETSVYYRSVYSKKGLTRFSGANLKRENGQTYNPSSKTGILLPEFPRMSELNFSKPFPVEKVETFLLMYRAHCQRILDSVVRANFHEVQDFLVHFWQGMPTHMLPILGCQATVDLVVVCDFILYRTLCEVLIPATLQALPDNLMEEVVTFSHNIVEWLYAALQDLPAALGIRKVQTGEIFGKSLRRQTALVQLAKGARSVLRNSEAVSNLLSEWRCIDFDNVARQAALNQQMGEPAYELISELAHELEQLFVKQSTLEVYFEWLDSIIERRVSEPSERGLNIMELSQDFLCIWSYFYVSLEKEVSLIDGKCFDSFRTLYLTLDEYVNYVTEILQARVIEKQYNDVLKVHGNPEQAVGSPPATTCVFPPTPDHTPNSSDQEFFRTFESTITAEIQDTNSLFTTGLHSPSLTPLTDSFCDGFFKQELSTFRPPCAVTHSAMQFDHAPLTPQSYSSNSPLSHCSLQSPEPSSDTEFGSLGSTSPCSSVDMTQTFSTGIPATSTIDSCPTEVCALDIAASLELVAEGCTPPLPATSNSAGYDFITQVSTAACPFYQFMPQMPNGGDQGYVACPQYEFELLQMIPDPDELLANPFSNKGAKPLFQSPPSTPIH